MTNFNCPLLLDLAEFSVDSDRAYFEFFKHIRFRVRKNAEGLPPTFAGSLFSCDRIVPKIFA